MNILVQKTFVAKPKNLIPKWYWVDASNQTLGRIGTIIANVLRGKNKPIFTPHTDCGDFVIVINSEKVKLTGKKWTEKMYYRHSNHVGGLKALNAKAVLQKSPERLIFEAVEGMLPKNKLADKIIKKLKVFKGPNHSHAAQNPVELRVEIPRTIPLGMTKG